jgi:hypothetical protein
MMVVDKGRDDRLQSLSPHDSGGGRQLGHLIGKAPGCQR